MFAADLASGDINKNTSDMFPPQRLTSGCGNMNSQAMETNRRGMLVRKESAGRSAPPVLLPQLLQSRDTQVLLYERPGYRVLENK